jgi:DNA ligase 1
MKAFARLLDRLVLTPSRNGKLTLLVDYFRNTPDPDRGYALAALTDGLDIKGVKPALLKELVLERMDPILFQYSYDYVGDLAETISLVWEPQALEAEAEQDLESLSRIVERLQQLGRNETRSVMRDLFDRLDTSGRFALIKLVTGGLRIGVSARLTKQALALYGDKDVVDIESLWHGLKPPYTELFDWLENRADKPVLSTPAIFHSVMLSTPIEDRDLPNLDPKDFAAEWMAFVCSCPAPAARAGSIRAQATTSRGRFLTSSRQHSSRG